MRKGLWSPDEDERLLRCITKYVNGSWSEIAQKAGLDRCGKSCRRRWMNHLRPDLKRCKFSMDEINLIVQLQEALGNRWSDIASHLEGRTDNDVKNLWNTKIKRRLLQLKNQNGVVSASSSTLISFGNANLVDACSGRSSYCEGPDQLINDHNSAWSSNYLISRDIKSQINLGLMQKELCTAYAATQTSCGKAAVDCFAPALLRSCNTSVFSFETAPPPPPPLPPITATSMSPYTRVIDFRGTYEDNSVEFSCMPEAELQCHTKTDSNSINENEQCSSEQLTINPLLITQLVTKASPIHLLSSVATRETNADCNETLQQQYCCCNNNISIDIDHINAAGSNAAPPPIAYNTSVSTILWDQLESMPVGLDLAECNMPQLSLPDWWKFLQSDLL